MNSQETQTFIKTENETSSQTTLIASLTEAEVQASAYVVAKDTQTIAQKSGAIASQTIQPVLGSTETQTVRVVIQGAETQTDRKTAGLEIETQTAFVETDPLALVHSRKVERRCIEMAMQTERKEILEPVTMVKQAARETAVQTEEVKSEKREFQTIETQTENKIKNVAT